MKYYITKKIEAKSKAEARAKVEQLYNVIDKKCYAKQNGKKKQWAFFIVCEANNKGEALIRFETNYGIKISNENDINTVVKCNVDDTPAEWRLVNFSKESNQRFKRILYVGTHITEKSIEAGIPYKQVIKGNIVNLSNNDFWPILSYVYDIEFSNNPNELINQCHYYNIGLVDLIGECECFGSADNAIIEGTETQNPYFLKILEENNFDYIVFNVNSTYKKFEKMYSNVIIDQNRIIEDLISTSGAAQSKGSGKNKKVYSKERKDKEKEWKNAIDLLQGKK